MTQGKKDRAAIARIRERGLRVEARETLRRLREQIRQKRAKRREAVRNVRTVCRTNLREWREKIAAARAEVRRLIGAKREELGRCRLAPYTTRAAMDRALDDAIRELAAERSLQAEMRSAEGRTRSKAAARITLREKRRESDDEVRGNLTAELVPVWEAVKGRIKATDRISRTEAFLQWAHDHSAEVAEIMARHADEEGERQWSAMLAEEARIAKALKRPKGFAHEARKRYRQAYGQSGDSEKRPEQDRRFEVLGPPPFGMHDDPDPRAFIGWEKKIDHAKRRARERSTWPQFRGQRFGVRDRETGDVIAEYRDGQEIGAAPF